jgi:hypothetical protein
MARGHLEGSFVDGEDCFKTDLTDVVYEDI